jgi:hypothetical protein
VFIPPPFSTPTSPRTIEVAVSNSAAVQSVAFFDETGGGSVALGSDSSSPYTASWTPFSTSNCDGPSQYALKATVTDKCGDSADYPNTGQVICQFPALNATPAGAMSWVSELAVPGAVAQVVVNGSQAFFPAAGRSNGALQARRGENRLEGQLVSANGQPGTWKLELSGEVALVPGSLRVTAGEVLSADARSVTFRLQGKAGERVVVTFVTR